MLLKGSTAIDWGPAAGSTARRWVSMRFARKPASATTTSAAAAHRQCGSRRNRPGRGRGSAPATSGIGGGDGACRSSGVGGAAVVGMVEGGAAARGDDVAGEAAGAGAGGSAFSASARASTSGSGTASSSARSCLCTAACRIAPARLPASAIARMSPSAPWLEYGSSAASLRHASTAPAASPAARRSAATPSRAWAYVRCSRARSASTHCSSSGPAPAWKPSMNGPPYNSTAAACSPRRTASSNAATSTCSDSGSSATSSAVVTTTSRPSALRSTCTATESRWCPDSASLSGQR